MAHNLQSEIGCVPTSHAPLSAPLEGNGCAERSSLSARVVRLPRSVRVSWGYQHRSGGRVSDGRVNSSGPDSVTKDALYPLKPPE